jgi:hypothetical protein
MSPLIGLPEFRDEQSQAALPVLEVAELKGEGGNKCGGQWVEWSLGSIWDTYPYQQHDDELLPWVLIDFESERNRICLRSLTCLEDLSSPREIYSGTCNTCNSILHSRAYAKFKDRASGKAAPRTPWIYLSSRQLRDMLSTTRRQNEQLRLKVYH